MPLPQGLETKKFLYIQGIDSKIHGDRIIQKLVPTEVPGGELATGEPT
jgi:hypothetical protein